MFLQSLSGFSYESVNDKVDFFRTVPHVFLKALKAIIELSFNLPRYVLHSARVFRTPLRSLSGIFPKKYGWCWVAARLERDLYRAKSTIALGFPSYSLFTHLSYPLVWGISMGFLSRSLSTHLITRYSLVLGFLSYSLFTRLILFGHLIAPTGMVERVFFASLVGIKHLANKPLSWDVNTVWEKQRPVMGNYITDPQIFDQFVRESVPMSTFSAPLLSGSTKCRRIA